jgi:hypothetical protein
MKIVDMFDLTSLLVNTHTEQYILCRVERILNRKYQEQSTFRAQFVVSKHIVRQTKQ